ncbi:YdcF family protein [Arsenicicoccus bolidensis]|uniref:YdcF family protein n=1 Tax=Arsenicicoccus bolidensis TaxID=229480 RepID=A0ABS9PXZ9_9MICO|nr:ElyC/SanA/YdcF family protein [Arsenicicoccus bolidensis]MCG7320513.1 YdcF family protein [Arsenicicoccus bolidensis]
MSSRLRIGCLASLGVALAMVCVLVVVILFPRHDPVGRSDAIVVLGPSVDERVTQAELLMRKGAAGTMVVSAHPADLGRVPDVCAHEKPYPVVCFDPVPSTTQGEARAVAKLARERGWTSLQVITFDPQVERARLILGRCFPGRISMLDHTEGYDLPVMLVYQSGGWAKALISPGC